MTDDIQIREAVLDDVDDLDAIRQLIFPWHSATVETQRNWFTSMPEAARSLRLSAVADGSVVGFVAGELNVTAAEPGQGHVHLIVHPAFRGRAIGKRFYDPVEEHMRAIGVRQAQGYALDDPSALAWVQRQGYQLGASTRWSVVDPRDLPQVPDKPADVEVASIAEVGPEAVHDLDNAAFLDEPGDVANGPIPYDQWMNQFWNSPGLDHEVSMVALVDGVAAASTLVEVNRKTGRAISAGTCTRPEFRGWGLAKLIKSVSLRRAADAGVTAAFTGNDYSNGPMVAINDWLGYRIIGGSRSVLKTL